MKRPKELIGNVLLEWEIKPPENKENFLKILPLALISLVLLCLFFALKENTRESWTISGLAFIFFTLTILFLGTKKEKPIYYAITTAGVYGYQKDKAIFLRWSELNYFYRKPVKGKDMVTTFVLVLRHNKGPWSDFFKFIILKTKIENSKKVRDILLEHLKYKLPNVREFYLVLLLYALILIIILSVYFFLKLGILI